MSRCSSGAVVPRVLQLVVGIGTLSLPALKGSNDEGVQGASQLWCVRPLRVLALVPLDMHLSVGECIQ